MVWVCLDDLCCVAVVAGCVLYIECCRYEEVCSYNYLPPLVREDLNRTYIPSNQCAIKEKWPKRNIERRRETLLYIGINIE
jgi:hypothetical protein